MKCRHSHGELPDADPGALAGNWLTESTLLSVSGSVLATDESRRVVF